MKVVCVAEKPSIAKAIAHALGGGNVTKSQSRSKFIWNYMLNYNVPKWGPCEFVVTSVKGHLTDVSFLPPHDRFDSNAAELFKAPILENITKDNVQVARNIETQCRGAHILYIWTDCDREGEHIGGEIVKIATKVNRKIKIYRAHFNNTEETHLLTAAKNPRELNRNMVDAVDARRELDLRSGFSLTRLQTRIYKQRYPVFSKRAIQYGSCQFPTLGFVVDRYLKIKNFVPEAFWTIDAKVKGTAPGKLVELSWDRNRVYDHVTALCLYERALKNAPNSKFRVIDIKKKAANRYKPLPLTTVILQKKASQFLKLTSKRIMELAEKLYNNGYVSYPRTETDRFDKGIDLRKLVANHTRNDLPWGEYTKGLINGKFQEPRKGKNDDKAHPPIHPVRSVSRSVITDNDEWRVYEFITRSFLACCSPDATGYTTTINLSYGTESFHTQGTQVKDRGFLDVYPYQTWNENTIPNWGIGDGVECSSIMLREGKTTPPTLLSESELVGLMDANGIGTDATMADHIARIQEIKYVKKKNQLFEPTPLGIALVMSYESIGLGNQLSKPFLRKETEVLVSKIAGGERPKAEVLKELVKKYEDVFKIVQNKENELMIEAKKHLN